MHKNYWIKNKYEYTMYNHELLLLISSITVSPTVSLHIQYLQYNCLYLLIRAHFKHNFCFFASYRMQYTFWWRRADLLTHCNTGPGICKNEMMLLQTITMQFILVFLKKKTSPITHSGVRSERAFQLPI